MRTDARPLSDATHLFSPLMPPYDPERKIVWLSEATQAALGDELGIFKEHGWEVRKMVFFGESEDEG